MPPNPEIPVFNIDSVIPPYIPPIPEVPIFNVDLLSDDDFSSSSSSSEEQVPEHTSIYESIEIPIEQNLRELLIKTTGTKNIETVTEVKLRVISRDVSLQLLMIHTPLLKELTLDGSYVSSLRDLGCGLKNLKILRVNRCSLTSFDGTFGLESVEELYAAGNAIETLCPCSFLPNLRLLDVAKNRLREITSILYLATCPLMEHICVEGNEELDLFPKRRQSIKNLLPKLKTLDGIPFTEEECKEDFSDVDEDELERYLQVTVDKKIEAEYSKELNILARLEVQGTSSPRPVSATGYVVKFPPKALATRPQTASTSRTESSAATEIVVLADKSKLVVPSKLTSGSPICGNVAAALRKRNQLQEAWGDDKSDED